MRRGTPLAKAWGVWRAAMNTVRKLAAFVLIVSAAGLLAVASPRA
jgi:hypothetical protein